MDARPPLVGGLDYAAVNDLVASVAERLGMAKPAVAFVPPRVSFLPVVVLRDRLVVTPAAMAMLPRPAMEFAVAHGLVMSRTRGGAGLRLLMTLLAIAAGIGIARGVHGTLGVLLAGLAGWTAAVALNLGYGAIRRRLRPGEVERETLRAVGTVEGARQYQAITDRYDLTGASPQDWKAKHARLFDLARFEAVALEMGLPA